MALAIFIRNAKKLNVNTIYSMKKIQPISISTKALVSTKTSVNKIPYARSISLSAPNLSTPGSSHVGLWTAERIVSIALLGVIPAAFIMPSQFLDAAMAVSVMMHQYWGLEAICTDYLRPGVVGQFISKFSHIMLIVITAATLSGLFYFIYNDVGIAKSVKKIWAIKGQ